MILWNEIDTVLLDMDGTLLDLNFDTVFWRHHLPERYAQIHGMEAGEVRDMLLALYREMEGSLPWYCVDHWSEKLDTDIARLKEEIIHLIQIRPHAIRFLEWLKQHGKYRLLITNAHRKSLNIKLRVTNIDNELDAVVSSHDFGYPKEDPRFWQKLIETQQINLQRSLFIDDSLHVLKAAHKAGVGQLLQILAPDSGQPHTLPGEFQAIHHFDEILPSTTDG